MEGNILLDRCSMWVLNDTNIFVELQILRPNRVTSVPIEKELHSFCDSSFVSEKLKLVSLGNILILEFALSWDLFYYTFTGYLSAFIPPTMPMGQKLHQDRLSLTLMLKKLKMCSFK